MNSVNHNKLLKSIPCVQISHVTKRFGEDLVLKEVNLDLHSCILCKKTWRLDDNAKAFRKIGVFSNLFS